MRQDHLAGTVLGEILSEVGGGASRAGSADVRWLQQALNWVAGERLVEDGISGPATTAAVRRFQARRGLPADGIAGPQTRAALLAAGAAPPVRTITMPTVVITAAAAVFRDFDFDRAELKPAHGAQIQELAARIARTWQTPAPIRTVYVVGHTDPVGSPDYNMGLGQRRGLAVRTALARALDQQQRGLSSRVLILVSSKGEQEAFNDDQGSNRRVEVTLSTRQLRPRRPPPPPRTDPPGPVIGPPPPQPPPPPPPPPSTTCDRAQLERLVNRCVADTKQCAIDATTSMALALRLNPFDNARAAAAYLLALRRCRETLLECDRRAKEDTHCR